MPTKDTAKNIRRSKNLSRRLIRVDERLDKITHEILTTDETSNTYWNKVQREIRKAYEEMRKITRDWTPDNISVAYNDSVRKQIRNIKNRKIIDPGVNTNKNSSTFINQDGTKQSKPGNQRIREGSQNFSSFQH